MTTHRVFRVTKPNNCWRWSSQNDYLDGKFFLCPAGYSVASGKYLSYEREVPNGVYGPEHHNIHCTWVQDTGLRAKDFAHLQSLVGKPRAIDGVVIA